MLLTFFALSTGVALVTRRSLVEKAGIVLSAFPIAVFANLVRIVVTAILADTVGAKTATLVFHDLAGWLMMPLALGFLGLELVIIDKLFVHTPAGSQSALGIEDFAPHFAAVSSPKKA